MQFELVNLEDIQIKYGLVMPAMAEIYEMYEMSEKAKSSENLQLF